MTNPCPRLMGPGYARALRIFFDSGADWHTLMTLMEVNRMTAIRICHGFHDKGLIHVAGWVRDTGGRLFKPWYAGGAGEDAQHPGTPRRRRHGLLPIELRTFCNAVEALQADSHHGGSLAAAVGWSPKTARATLLALHAERLAYIFEYQPRINGGSGYPLYAWGPGRADAKKPRPKSARELWTKNNGIKAQRRRQANLLRAMVGGVDYRAHLPVFGQSTTS